MALENSNKDMTTDKAKTKLLNEVKIQPKMILPCDPEMSNPENLRNLLFVMSAINLVISGRL